MLQIDWEKNKGWGNPIISKFDDFNISPAALVFHYAMEVWTEDKNCIFV